MKLKKGVSTAAFIHCVDKCQEDVIYETMEGDRLNLKSQLSKYLFLVAVNHPDAINLSDGTILCDSEDFPVLEAYLDA